ncbi:MAG TPA: acetoacetate--CoA ligase [Gemmatimonadaceae bacterium]|nr:acetoacetate--CoA ligase [Gemmatimonadaceae bacterium]
MTRTAEGAQSRAPLYVPPPADVAATRMADLIRRVAASPEGQRFGVDSYDSLYRWSVAHPEEFWPEVWRFGGVIAEGRPGREPWDEVVRGLDRMAPPDRDLGPRWFVGSRLNFAENLLRARDEATALVSWTERGRERSLSCGALRTEVARIAAALREAGVRPGDRVAGFLPNIPEAVIAMLATASLGAVWSSCSPDFGVQGVLDRFGQIAPRVLICADGYVYAGKRIDSLERARKVVEALPAVERVVVVTHLGEAGGPAGVPRATSWEDFAAEGAGGTTTVPLAFERLPFDHPLYIMYSSGTTGLPKCMVHGAGGTLVQHLKEHVLHTDLRPGNAIFYFTTCGWMMWNWLVSALSVEATVVLYDGAPLPAERDILWRIAEEERLTVFGTSARYLALAGKAGVRPAERFDLSALRAIVSTGSPLGSHSYEYVYSAIKRDVRLCNISGGTDLISCFALGNPMTPVWPGEIQTRGLGMAVEAFDEAGRPVRGAPGELVCTRPFPSMPLAFWNDPDGASYRAAYFEKYPNVWRHGDWAELTPRGGVVIHGRSDATLNPGGVRIGTAEIYRQVERLPEIVESIAVAQDVPGGEPGDVRIVLFVQVRDGGVLDDELRDRIRRAIRENASPHHVPKLIVQVADIPRTISGKITELAVRDVIHGRPVRNADALANPDALELYRDIPALRS